MIQVQDLRFRYPGTEEDTVRGIDFEMGKGEIFGFLGPSGAGKSTVQKILTKIYRSFEGEVQFMGKNIQDYGPDFYEHIGVGFELPNHYSKLSALENLKFFASFYNRKTRDPMDLLGMVGLEQDAHKRVSDYSKGMKMRLNFIRSFLHDPEVLFLDEPTSGLDPGNARLMKDIILDLQEQGTTIFVTTHIMQDAEELCDRVGFIVDGEIAAIDAPKALKLQHGERKVKVEYQNDGLQSKEFELDGIADNEAFLQTLRDYPIETIHTEEASLDRIFIEVTGKHLRPNA